MMKLALIIVLLFLAMVVLLIGMKSTMMLATMLGI